jgi:hypothetical protein
VDHFANRVIGRAEYLAARAAIDSRLGATRRALERNTGAGVLASLPAADLRKAWDSGSFDWRRALIGAILERAVIAPARKRGLPRFDPERVDLVWRA